MVLSFSSWELSEGESYGLGFLQGPHRFTDGIETGTGTGTGFGLVYTFAPSGQVNRGKEGERMAYIDSDLPFSVLLQLYHENIFLVSLITSNGCNLICS